MRHNQPAAVLIGLVLLGLAPILQAEEQPAPLDDQGVEHIYGYVCAGSWKEVRALLTERAY